MRFSKQVCSVKRFDLTSVKYQMTMFNCRVQCWTANVKIQFWNWNSVRVWGLCLKTFTPSTQSWNPLQYKGRMLLSSSQTRVQISGDTVVNRCQSTTAAAAVTRLLWSCPGEADARAGLGSSHILFCISAKFVVSEMRRDNEKTESRQELHWWVRAWVGSK